MVLPPPLPSFQNEMFMWFASKNITYKQIGFTATWFASHSWYILHVPPYLVVPPILGVPFPLVCSCVLLLACTPPCGVCTCVLLPGVCFSGLCSSSGVCAPPLHNQNWAQPRQEVPLTHTAIFLNLIFLIYSKSSLPCIEEYYDCLNQIICFLF